MVHKAYAGLGHKGTIHPERRDQA